MPARPSWPPKSAPRLFVEQKLAQNSPVELRGNQAHYLGKVMRVAPGDGLILCDNQTGEWAARVGEVTKRTVSVIAEKRLRTREEVPDFWLCPALLKKDRFDFVLEKATELGTARIQPIITRRCVADKLNPDRARSIVTEAAEQCARTALPDLAQPMALNQLLENWPETRALFFADEMGGANAASSFSGHSGPAALIIGPEGGFDASEREAIRAHPMARPITLGPRILRGETAAIAATALWMGLRGDWSV